MRATLKMFAAAAALAAGVSSAAMAQYPCAPGYSLYGGVCQPSRPLGYSNPVSGAVQGEASGRAGSRQVKDANVSFVGASAPIVTGTTFIFVGEPY